MAGRIASVIVRSALPQSLAGWQGALPQSISLARRSGWQGALPQSLSAEGEHGRAQPQSLSEASWMAGRIASAIVR